MSRLKFQNTLVVKVSLGARTAGTSAKKVDTMVETDTGVWRSLENLSRTAFVVSGVLFLFTFVVDVVNAVTSMSLTGAVTGLPTFVGMLFLFIGVFGIYPLLADRAPQLALGGTVLVVGSLTVNIVLLIVFVRLLGPSPPFADILGALIEVLWILSGVGGAVLGFASRRTRGLSRAVDIGFFVFFIAGLIAAVNGFVYGGNAPAWAAANVDVLGGVSMVAVGYGLTYSDFADLSRTSDTTA